MVQGVGHEFKLQYWEKTKNSDLLRKEAAVMQ
jgi:hypothetical protein